MEPSKEIGPVETSNDPGKKIGMVLMILAVVMLADRLIP
jgi:hypothetical protein